MFVLEYWYTINAIPPYGTGIATITVYGENNTNIVKKSKDKAISE